MTTAINENDFLHLSPHFNILITILMNMAVFSYKLYLLSYNSLHFKRSDFLLPPDYFNYCGILNKFSLNIFVNIIKYLISKISV